MGVILKNNATSTITTAISASDVGLAVAAGTGSLFPTLGAGDYFYATLVSAGGTYEVIKVTVRAGDTMTIVRAQEGTTAQSFASGSRIEVRVTAASIQDMLDYHDQASEISFTPTGGISSTDVQAAIAELDSEAAKSAALAASGGSALVGFLQAGSGAVTRTGQSKLRDVVNAKDFGAVGDGVADDTVALQAFLNACQNGRGYLSKGTYRITSPLVVDHRFSCNIEGDSWDNSNNGGGATRIVNAGTGNAIEIIQSPYTGQFDKQIRFANFTLEGNINSQSGFYVVQTLVFLENLWITNHGVHGAYLDKVYGSAFKQVIFAQNYRSGCVVNNAGNALHFDHCLFNGNARLNGGYAGCDVSSSASPKSQNLGLVFTSCDFTGNGYPAGVIDGFGIAIKDTWGISLIGCYAELNKTRNLYADNSVRNLTVTGGYWQDSITEIVDVFGLVYENNIHQFISLPTQVNISGSTTARRLNRVFGNTVTGGATQTYSIGVKQRSEVYANAIPTSGTWEVGDIVWYNNPDWGLPIGWVCVAAGTPGTWRQISERIPGAYDNWGDTSTTLNPLGSLGTNLWRNPLTADRTVTLSTVNAFSGCKFRITRTTSSTGAFNLNVGSGPLKALAAGQWCDVEYEGSVWILTAFGSL